MSGLNFPTTELANVALLAGDALIYFTALAALFRARERLGIGAFFCALGVMHFLETYLASILYVALPFGIVASPGSTVLFTGKLVLLLIVYIREDAVVVRQPIYGLLLGNLLLLALAFLVRQHNLVPLAPGRAANFGFLDEMGALMLWGTVVLFVDCILIILLYERLRSWLGGHTFSRIALSAAVVLSFDQVAFFLGLHVLTGAGMSVLLGGWAAKMGAVALYSVLAGIYLQAFERPPQRRGRGVPRISDVFDTLTYRERYEDLLARIGRDALTGALDRGRLETQGRRAVDELTLAGRPVSLLLIDVDHFKTFNDRFGHAAGDRSLRAIAQHIMATVRGSDLVFRFGGEEFVVIADGIAGAQAMALGERIRREIAARDDAATPQLTVSIGIASCADDPVDYDSLFAMADKRLYQAKAEGRDRVVGEPSGPGDRPASLAHAT